ncbi:MAG: iron ABC transporter permease [Crenarchaeota archaeon]|nr:iron ABC transporter permease [Thermoproteota archaeon]
MNNIRSPYRLIIVRRLIIVISFSILTFVLFLLDLCVGSSGISIHDVVEVLLNLNKNPILHAIIFDFRLPWSLMAVVVGFSLGVAGAVMQTILNNPLASPYTLGISHGAGFGAALVYSLGVSILGKLTMSTYAQYIVPINAFVFALITCGVIVLIGKVRGFTYETLILAGIAMSFLFSALLSLMEYFASEEALQAIVFWLFGSLVKATLLNVLIVSIVMIISTVILMRFSWELTTLRLGDEKARSLGANPERIRLVSMIIASILTAAAVCFVGIIGFVGLVAPHIARFLTGEDARFLVPTSGLAGSIMLSGAAIASKTIMSGAILPIGIVTSIIGIPFFLYLIIKGKRGVW